ncbi:MAG: toprim domain-containing protein [Candidatus Nanohaloarchaea archaeon]
MKQIAEELDLQVEGRYSDRTDYYCPECDLDTGDLSVYHGSHFACHGEGGESPATLVMHTKGWNSVDKAVEWLKEHFPEEFKDVDKEDVDRKQKAIQVLTKATELAHDSLKKRHSDILEDIKERRSFEEEDIEKSRPGIPTSDDIEILKQRFDKQALLDSGFFGQSEDGELYSHLENRIIWPYLQGNRTVFTIGRRLPGSDSDAKYKKNYTTDYIKNTPYELQGEKDGVFITEGITDSISANKAGFTVVSPVTTRFSNKEVEKVVERVQHAENVYIAMDQDGPGQKGQRKTAELLLENGVNPYMIDLPEGMDLDDWTSENGYDLTGLIEDAKTFLDQLIQEAKNADNRKQGEKCKEVLNLVKDWSDIDIDPILTKLPVKKPKLEDELKELRAESTEDIEDIENTEQYSQYDQSWEGKIDQLAEAKQPVKKRLTGVVNGTFFQTIWIYDQERGRFRKAIITSDGQIKQIRNKKSERKIELEEQGKWKEVPKKDKQAIDYDYINLNDEEVQFKHKIADKPAPQIRAPTNQVIKLVKNPDQIKNKEQLFDEIIEFIKRYWNHYHEEWYDLIAAYIVHTYLITPIGYTFYLYLHGEPDTGKTNLQLASSWLEYNGLGPNVGTPKASIRFAHSFQASLNLEETEKGSEESRSDTEQLFNSGYRKNGSYPIADPDRVGIEDQITSIYSFNPKKISANSIKGWADSFESRCVFLKTVRTDEDMDDPAKIEMENKGEAQQLRNHISAFTLFNWEKITDQVSSYRDKLNVSGREADKIALFCGILKYFKGEDRATKLKSRIKEEEDISGVSDISKTVQTILDKIILDFNDKEADQIRIRFQDLAEYVNEELDRSEDYQLSSQGVGKRLRDYDLIRSDSMKVKDQEGYTCLEIDKTTFKDSMTRYNLTEYIDDLVDNENQDSSKNHPSESTEHTENSSISSISSISSVDDLDEQVERVLKFIKHYPKAGSHKVSKSTGIEIEKAGEILNSLEERDLAKRDNGKWKVEAEVKS